MNEQEARKLIRQKLTTGRYEHSLRVAETAKNLAMHYQAPVDKAVLAGLLHDYAKCEQPDQLRDQIVEHHLPEQLLEYHHELWHGPVAAKVMEASFSITDDDILHAIYYHTTGRAEMSLLEVIIFVADYIEPKRAIPGIDEVRNLATENIYLAARKAIQNTIVHLMKKDASIHPDSFIAYNEWTKNMQRGF